MANLTINTDAMVNMLVGLLNTPSPTGYHVEVIGYTQLAFEALAIPGLEIKTTQKGALVLYWPGESDSAPRGITGHVDTLGLMVKTIKPSGRLTVTNLGGIMWGGIEMEGVTIRTHDDRRYRGTVLPENPSTHVNRKIHTSERNADTMEVRIDAKTSSAEETHALGIEVGDFVFVDPRVEISDTGFVRGRFLDDKAGIATIYGAMMALRDAGLRPVQDTYFQISNYEEVGHGGSPDWPENLAELLAVDMGAIGEGQNSDEFSVSICIKDAGGPYHFEMNNKLRRLATDFEISHHVDIYTYYASDGTIYWRSGGGARVGLVGPGIDCSHAYERTHRESLYHSANLIARYLLDG